MDEEIDEPRLSDRLREKVLSLQCEAMAAASGDEPHRASGYLAAADLMASIADRLDARRGDFRSDD